MRRMLQVAMAGMAALVLPFCGSSGDEGACTPGKVAECPCPGGAKGVQRCNSDGAGFGQCTGCEGSGDGGGGASASGGTAGDGGESGSAGKSGNAGASGEGGASGNAGAGGAGMSGAAGASGTAASCPPDEATNATTDECDVVEQNCSGGRTCSIEEEADAGTWRTRCTDLGRGTKAMGEICTGHSQCVPGLRCTLSKCTQPCCPAVEDDICGKAANGKCDLTINFGGGESFLRVCTFSPPCNLWANDCPSGPESDCHIGFDNEISCSFPNYTMGTQTLGDACMFLNDCQGNQHCSGGFCRWLCKVKDAGAPPHGTVGGTPGDGGCPTGQTCSAFSSPDWLGVCGP